MMKRLVHQLKRAYHPGFHLQNMKIALPLPPKDLSCHYEAAVIGNAIQKLQLQSNIGYNTNDIISKMELTKEFYPKQYVDFLPTSHQTPVVIALNSVRHLSEETVDAALRILKENRFIDSGGLLRIQDFASSDIMTSVNKLNNNVLNNAMRGILSDYADSIYIANDYLLIPGKDIDYIFIANYPKGAEMRDTERARMVATGLFKGQMPILLSPNINFEGEANIKFLPLKINCQGKQYQAALSYDSSRSESVAAIREINQYLVQLGIDSIFDIQLCPETGIEEILYHQDCALNFYSDKQKTQFLEVENLDVMEILNGYCRNGTVAMIKGGLHAKSEQILHNLFDHVIQIDRTDDLLGANVVMSEYGCVGSSKLSNATKDEIKRANRFLEYEHPSAGGGGAHKCCSNITTSGRSELSIPDWIQFVSHFDINLPKNFIHAVELEMQRLRAIMTA